MLRFIYVQPLLLIILLMAAGKPCSVCCGYADFKAGFCAYFFGYIPKNYFLGGNKLSYNSAAVFCSSFFVRQKNIRVRKRTCYAIYKKYF